MIKITNVEGHQTRNGRRTEGSLTWWIPKERNERRFLLEIFDSLNHERMRGKICEDSYRTILKTVTRVFKNNYDGSPPQGSSRGTAGQITGFAKCASQQCVKHDNRSAAGAPRWGRRHSSQPGVWGHQPPSKKIRHGREKKTSRTQKKRVKRKRGVGEI
jgi:hypothetical protein